MFFPVPGMLSAAVCGDVFASPSSSAVLEGIKSVAGKKGVLLVVKNYTGDRLNFGRAAMKAKSEGILDKVEMVVVGEDCGIPRTESFAGRRGLVGTVLVEKIAGHVASLGKSLEEVTAMAQLAADNVGTVGFSLSPCSIPGKSPAFSLESDEIELALGIHGEPGIKRMNIQPAKDLVRICIDMILSEEADRNYLPVDKAAGDRVALVVNNLGGTSGLELAVVVNDAVTYLDELGLSPVRTFAGAWMTSLEMQGVQICLLRLPAGKQGDQLVEALDGETDAMAWPRVVDAEALKNLVATKPVSVVSTPQPSTTATTEGSSYLTSLALAISNTVLAAEPDLTRFDQLSGDGDAGNTIASGAKSIISAINSQKLVDQDPANFVRNVSELCEHSMGGSFGAVLCIFLDSLSAGLRGAGDKVSKEKFAEALSEAAESVSRIGGARPGDRTMVDALEPFARTFKETLDLNKAVIAARAGADGTKDMKSARMGRASYLVGKELDSPDPGAHAVALAVQAAAAVQV